MNVISQPSSAQETPGLGAVVFDDDFQLELVYFQAENTVFRAIKQWFLAEGSAFADMHLFSSPASESRSTGQHDSSGIRNRVKGESLSHPIILEQTKAADFKAFLSVLNPLSNRKLTLYDEWVGALDLATRWKFNDVRTKAIDALNIIILKEPAMRICLGEKYLVSEWFRGGLIDIVNKVIEENLDPDTLGNAPMSLDYVTISKIFYICYQIKGLSATCQCNPRKGTIRLFRYDVCDHCGVYVSLSQRPSPTSPNHTHPFVDRVFSTKLAECTYVPHDPFTYVLDGRE